MNVVEVIPITRGITKESFSYFSVDPIEEGAIVMVSLRKRIVPALVVATRNAETLKSEIKSGDFALKRITKVYSDSFFSPAFLKTAADTALEYATTSGAVLSVLVPKAVFDNIKKIKSFEHKVPAGTSDKRALQTNNTERYAHYKSLIREEFARKRSVFFCLPTIEDIKHMQTILEKGIEHYTFVLHSKLGPKEIVKQWNKVLETSHPVLIIGTGQFLSLNRSDIQTIIVDKESSRNYKGLTRPYLDMRIFAEKLAENSGARLIVGDLLLRTETIWQARTNDRYSELSPLKFRALTSAETIEIDMRVESDNNNKKFRIFSDELEKVITRNKENNERLFLFGARKGYATSTVCADCGEIVHCTNCGAPNVLYSLKVEENYFFCSKCGEKRPASERCVRCESWNLTPLGIGVERIEAELHSRFPDIKIFRLDKESVSTEKRALEIVSKFLGTPGSVLVGTELALMYLREKIENTAIVSIDSLFAVPDFRISEKLFHILLETRELAERRFLLQTRNADENLYKLALAGNLMDFYRTEIAERKRFNYPPFSVFIKITLEGKRERVEAEMRQLKDHLQPFEADLFPAFDVPGIKHFAMHGLLKISSKDWPDKILVEKLLALPPHYRVKVDPDTLL